MTTSQLKVQWTGLKGKLKEQYGQLTDDDLLFAEGKSEELLSRLQERLGISREELDSKLDDLVAIGADKLEQGKAKAGEVSDQIRATASDTVDDLLEEAVGMGREVKAQATATYETTRRRARGLWENGEEYVRRNPRDTLLVAAAAGFVVGFLFLRRRQG